MVKASQLEKCLKKVEKPARYIGGELNSIVKDDPALRFAFCFPDVYEVGMSHLGMQILYFAINATDYACERVFAPWPDMAEEMQSEGIPLYSLETRTPLSDFDVVGFTLQYEMSYTNILYMLDLGGIPLLSKDRGEDDPIVIAGGPCATTPEPLADFIDCFVIGEGEELNIELLDCIRDGRGKNKSREEIFRALAAIDGVYIPSFYRVSYDEDGLIREHTPIVPEAKAVIERVRLHDMDEAFQLDRQIVPFLETVHDRAVLELFRGCTRGCRFCQAGMMYRPIREKSVDTLLESADRILKNTGYEEVSLTSLSSCDYTHLMPLVRRMVETYEDQNIGISLPSLRLDSFIVDVLREIEKVRKSGLTFAPEAGSQRMRDIINKNVTEEDLMRVAKAVFDEGWSRIKLYFMIGLPGETLEDVLGIAHLAYKVKDAFFNRPKEAIRGNFRVTASASCFVPKGFTPFQWVGQDSIEMFFEKINALKRAIRDPKVKFQYHEPYISRLEAILARGDRRVGELILRAYKNGQRFDGWSEYFDYDVWVKSMEEAGIDGDFYANRVRDYDEILPWDFVDIGVSKAYLWKEYQKSLQAITTDDCREHCNGCGIKDCEMWGEFHATASGV
ncbi:MAG: TIGR03960 family B12-binding radical SAM protein [Peptoniphilus sp.]|nr:TIGR03960 family B12-binding radical SAM protein [Peptoniphilus sp.]MDD7363683.1 TIGR03960 family B12-binding radical SAM protein [Bacillota bacterium]MDY6044068.1 TIGR03960 family B12-binding radical SAM protein [Peptoniphilus sp.]